LAGWSSERLAVAFKLARPSPGVADLPSRALLVAAATTLSTLADVFNAHPRMPGWRKPEPGKRSGLYGTALVISS
jgi:hypothetical protein